jgi:DNA repair protein RadC
VLELLLTYAIPQRDVLPLARRLIDKFGSLSGVLSAGYEDLRKIDGVKAYSAALLKLADWIRSRCPLKAPRLPRTGKAPADQIVLFEKPVSEAEMSPPESLEVKEEPPAKTPEDEPPREIAVLPRAGGLFAKAVLKEAILHLPGLPDTESLDEIRSFLRNNLHFSAEQTRDRYANYIVRRMFPNGRADRAMRSFASKYPQMQELRDAGFYRFCNAEPLMIDVAHELLIPSIGNGRFDRSRLRGYLSGRFPSYGSIGDCAKAVVEALSAGGIAKADRKAVSFSYREILIPSFAFVLHSEFPEPGMYDIHGLENNRTIRAMLWNPDRILPSLYELRNRGLISKVSEIDRVRQFTTRCSLEEVVERLAK